MVNLNRIIIKSKKEKKNVSKYKSSQDVISLHEHRSRLVIHIIASGVTVCMP